MRPIEEQSERESQRLWLKTVIAIGESNHTAATEEKSKVEDRQRDETAKRTEQGIEWQPKLFRPVRGGPGGPEEGEEDLDWILNANMYVFRYPADWLDLTTLAMELPLKKRPSRSSQSLPFSEANNTASRAKLPSCSKTKRHHNRLVGRSSRQQATMT